jgi:hypothetical protein
MLLEENLVTKSKHWSGEYNAYNFTAFKEQWRKNFRFGHVTKVVRPFVCKINNFSLSGCQIFILITLKELGSEKSMYTVVVFCLRN